MAEYLSPEWFDEANRVLDRCSGDFSGIGNVQLVIQQVVTSAPDADRAWALRIEGSRVRFERGMAPDAQASFTQDWETAVAVARGDLSLAAAFMSGRVRVRGELTALLGNQAVLADLDGAMAEVRSATTWPA